MSAPDIVPSVQPSLALAAVAICRGISDPGELRAALERAHVVAVLDRYCFMHPGAALAPHYDIGLGWGFVTHTYFANQWWETADAARAAAARAIEAGEV